MSFLNKSEEYSPACDYIEPFVRPSKVFYIPDHFEQTTPNIKDKTLFLHYFYFDNVRIYKESCNSFV